MLVNPLGPCVTLAPSLYSLEKENICWKIETYKSREILCLYVIKITRERIYSSIIKIDEIEFIITIVE